MSDFPTTSAAGVEAGTAGTLVMWQSGPAGALVEVVERLDARHPRGVVVSLSGLAAGLASSDRSLQSRYMPARAPLPSMCGRWPVGDSAKLRSLSPCLLARPCKVPAAEGFRVEIFRRDLLEGARATQAGYGVWGSAEWGKQYLEVSSPRTLEKMSSQKEGIMGNKRASSFDSMLWWIFSGGTNHDPQESGAGRWRTT